MCYLFRFLACGDSLPSMHYQYLLGITTVSNVISETCAAIWDVLQPVVLPAKLTRQQWLRIARDYERIWHFKHCIGSIDGKHIIIVVS